MQISHTQRKRHETFFCFLDESISNDCGKFSLIWTGCLSSTIHVLYNSLKVSYLTKKDVFQLILSQNDGTIKGCRREFRCFGEVTKLTAKMCSDTDSFKYFSNHVFWSQEFAKYLSYEAPLFAQHIQTFYADFKWTMKIGGKFFLFLEKSVLSECGKFSLVWTEYLSLAFHVSKQF